MKIALIDNQDSFVYNLVDALAQTGHDCTVYRNTVDVGVALGDSPDVVVLSPGPGHPTEAGNLMAVVRESLEQGIPVLGICLGFQALLDHFGGTVEPCGPVHGIKGEMSLTAAGQSCGIFEELTVDRDPAHPGVPGTRVPIARYHSLGCAQPPSEFEVLAWSDSKIGDVVQAAAIPGSGGYAALGLQFHPESVLSPTGPIILERCLEALNRR